MICWQKTTFIEAEINLRYFVSQSSYEQIENTQDYKICENYKLPP